MINTRPNLHPILPDSQLRPIIRQIFASDRGSRECHRWWWYAANKRINVHTSRQNTGKWRTKHSQTHLAWILQRSALRAMQTAVETTDRCWQRYWQQKRIRTAHETIHVQFN